MKNESNLFNRDSGAEETAASQKTTDALRRLQEQEDARNLAANQNADKILLRRRGKIRTEDMLRQKEQITAEEVAAGIGNISQAGINLEQADAKKAQDAKTRENWAWNGVENRIEEENANRPVREPESLGAEQPAAQKKQAWEMTEQDISDRNASIREQLAIDARANDPENYKDLAKILEAAKGSKAQEAKKAAEAAKDANEAWGKNMMESSDRAEAHGSRETARANQGAQNAYNAVQEGLKRDKDEAEKNRLRMERAARSGVLAGDEAERQEAVLQDRLNNPDNYKEFAETLAAAKTERAKAIQDKTEAAKAAAEEKKARLEAEAKQKQEQRDAAIKAKADAKAEAVRLKQEQKDKKEALRLKALEDAKNAKIALEAEKTRIAKEKADAIERQRQAEIERAAQLKAEALEQQKRIQEAKDAKDTQEMNDILAAFKATEERKEKKAIDDGSEIYPDYAGVANASEKAGRASATPKQGAGLAGKIGGFFRSIGKIFGSGVREQQAKVSVSLTEPSAFLDSIQGVPSEQPQAVQSAEAPAPAPVSMESPAPQPLPVAERLPAAENSAPGGVAESVEQTVNSATAETVTAATAEKPKATAENGKKLVRAERLSAEELRKIDLLKELKSEWREAEARFLKIEKIREMLKDKEYFVKFDKDEARVIKEGIVILGTKLLMENQDHSERIIKIASELAERDLKREAMAETNYNVGESDYRTGPKNRDAFEKKITKMIEDIYNQEQEKLGITSKTSLKLAGKKTATKSGRRGHKFGLVPADEIREAV